MKEGKLIENGIHGYYLTVNDKIYGVINNSDSKLQKISLKNCEAVKDGYDLDELAREACNITDPLRLDSQKYKQDPYFKIGFNKGAKAILEILGDKKFSETELYRAFLINSAGNNTTLENTFKEIVLPMFQQTEWDCTFNPDEKDSEGCLILKRKI